MDLPELPRRIYTFGKEPTAMKSISYHTDNSKLFAALSEGLRADEYEELKESKLGVFIKFKELNFNWASRLVHYILGFQLKIKKKYELWSLVGVEPMRFSLIEFEHLTGLNCADMKDLENPRCEVTKEMAAFWDKMGVHIEAGPNVDQIIGAFKRCQEWSREDRIRLGYLAILAGFIEGRKFSTPIRASLAKLVMDLEKFENYPWGRVAFKVLIASVKAANLEANSYTVDGFIQVLQVWVYNFLPDLGANFGNPQPNRPTPPLLAYKGGKGRRCFKEAILRQTKVINFIEKDFGEMFPRWEFDAEDSAADNIIKVMFNSNPKWKWTMDCWEVNQMNEVIAAETLSGLKEDSGRPRKKACKGGLKEACKEAPVEAPKDETEKSCSGMCLKEIKLLSDRLEAVEKMVGITKNRTSGSPKPPLHEQGVSTITSSKITEQRVTRQSDMNKN